MAGCPTEPRVTNSKAAVLTNKTNQVDAYYECLAGFVMSGNQTITCQKALGIWPNAPSCTVIESNVYVYTSNGGVGGGDDWWTYLLAVFLVGMLLIMLAFLIWCCCWAPRTQNCNCRCFQKGSRNTTPVSQGIYRDSIFWYSDRGRANQSNKGHLAKSDQNGLSVPPGKGQGQGQGQGHNSPAMIARHGQGEIDNQKSAREAPIYRTPRPAKDPARESKMWMPHSHSVRDINTSTK